MAFVQYIQKTWKVIVFRHCFVFNHVLKCPLSLKNLLKESYPNRYNYKPSADSLALLPSMGQIIPLGLRLQKHLENNTKEMHACLHEAHTILIFSKRITFQFQNLYIHFPFNMIDSIRSSSTQNSCSLPWSETPVRTRENG